MQWSVEKVVSDLFTAWYGSEPESISPLPPSGSNRQYFRIWKKGNSFIAAFNPDTRENKAFLALSTHFYAQGLPVPKILAEDTNAHAYLLTDLGDTNLFSLLPRKQSNNGFDENIITLYKKTINYLPAFQIDAAKGIDFGLCYPRHAFDKHSIMWDLNYFKYYFLKISGIQFDEQLLEDDFERFTNLLLKARADFFMYRDFQSRNVMIVKGEPYFIDYQGGRKGPLAYDIASLLFDAKANIPADLRMQLLDHYMDQLSLRMDVDRDDFRQRFFDFVLVRILQALGAYGYRGGVEKKPLFLQSVPYALRNLSWLSEQGCLPANIPYLNGLINEFSSLAPEEILPAAGDAAILPEEGLTVRVSSFSYKKSIPDDISGNGGGFVFDCRALPNPGRQEAYRMLTGKDPEVIRFLASDESVQAFFKAAQAMIAPAVKNYLDRKFNSLMVSFGCTGGQHRSVYCAERLSEFLEENFNVNVILKHTEEKNWPSSSLSQP